MLELLNVRASRFACLQHNPRNACCRSSLSNRVSRMSWKWTNENAGKLPNWRSRWRWSLSGRVRSGDASARNEGETTMSSPMTWIWAGDPKKPKPAAAAAAFPIPAGWCLRYLVAPAGGDVRGPRRAGWAATFPPFQRNALVSSPFNVTRWII